MDSGPFHCACACSGLIADWHQHGHTRRGQIVAGDGTALQVSQCASVQCPNMSALHEANVPATLGNNMHDAHADFTQACHQTLSHGEVLKCADIQCPGMSVLHEA